MHPRPIADTCGPSAPSRRYCIVSLLVMFGAVARNDASIGYSSAPPDKSRDLSASLERRPVRHGGIQMRIALVLGVFLLAAPAMAGDDANNGGAGSCAGL